MKHLVILFLLLSTYCYSQGVNSIKTVKLVKIDSNFVLYSEDENKFLFFSKINTDSISFNTLEDIYRNTASTDGTAKNKDKTNSWILDHAFLVNLLIILLIAGVTLVGVIISNRNNRRINRDNLQAAQNELTEKLSASQIEVDRKLTSSLNEKWIQNFREIVSAYLGTASTLFHICEDYISAVETNNKEEQLESLKKIHANYITRNNQLAKLSLFLNFHDEDDENFYKLIIEYNSWLMNLTQLKSFDVKILAKDFIDQEKKIKLEAQQIIAHTISSIFYQ